MAGASVRDRAEVAAGKGSARDRAEAGKKKRKKHNSTKKRTVSRKRAR